MLGLGGVGTADPQDCSCSDTEPDTVAPMSDEFPILMTSGFSVMEAHSQHVAFGLTP